MLKLTKTGIGLLTRQYRSVLKKCWLLNLGLFTLGAALMPNEARASITLYVYTGSNTSPQAVLNKSNSGWTGYSFALTSDLSSYQTKLSTSNKLNTSYISTNSSNRFVTDTQINNWNAKASLSEVRALDDLTNYYTKLVVANDNSATTNTNTNTNANATTMNKAA